MGYQGSWFYRKVLRYAARSFPFLCFLRFFLATKRSSLPLSPNPVFPHRSPFYDQLVKIVPMWVNPNWITLTGGCFAFISNIAMVCAFFRRFARLCSLPLIFHPSAHSSRIILPMFTNLSSVVFV